MYLLMSCHALIDIMHVWTINKNVTRIRFVVKKSWTWIWNLSRLFV